MPLRPLPPDFCPINDDLPEGWYCPVTILLEDYFIRLVKQKRRLKNKVTVSTAVEINLLEDFGTTYLRVDRGKGTQE
ncbi:MAG: hypothetical protein C4542_07245 [Dehalococcoidia bacterium]|nr:MAG: hypothetical protein C4542_07245 [Dehalococcoidia bacterium]